MENDDELLARCKSRVGSTLGSKWRLDRLLGVGGMAAVYSATGASGLRSARMPGSSAASAGIGSTTRRGA